MACQQNQGQDPSDSKRLTSKRLTSKRLTSKRLTNGEVINFLKTLPENSCFGHLEDNEDRLEEFLRHLYVSLRGLFSSTTTTSNANRTKILKIEQLEVLPSLHVQFPLFEDQPQKFWELHNTELQPYDNQQAREHRAKTFLQNAVQLDSNIQEQEILQRFVSVGAWKLFKREISTCGNRVVTTSLKRFLKHIGIQCSTSDENAVDTYGKIIRRGQRYESFCRELSSVKPSDENIEQSGTKDKREANQEENNEIFGPLFFSSIPNTICDDKGLLGKDFESSIKHLQDIGILETSRMSNAAHMAKCLFGFHETFFWVDETKAASSKRRCNKMGPTTTDRKRKRTCTPECSSTDNTFHQNTRGAKHPFAKAVGGQTLRSNIAVLDPNPERQAPETRVLREGDLAPPVPGEQAEQEVGYIPGAEESQPRSETLDLAACSTNSMNFVLPATTQTQGTHLDAPMMDFLTPLSHIPIQENIFDITALDFVAPFFDATDLDFVGPETPMFANTLF